MTKYILDNYGSVFVTVLSILTLLGVIKRAVNKTTDKVPGIVWWFAAWALGVVGALIVPQDCKAGDWRCWCDNAIIYGGFAIVLYPVAKRVVNKVRKLVS